MTTALPLVYVQLPLTFTNLWYDLNRTRTTFTKKKTTKCRVISSLISFRNFGSENDRMTSKQLSKNSTYLRQNRKATMAVKLSP